MGHLLRSVWVLSTGLLCYGTSDAMSHGNGSGRSQSGKSFTVPLQFEAGFPVIMARINGQKIPLMVDLAQTAPIALFPAAVDSVKPQPVDSQNQSVPLIRIQRLDIGDLTFTDVEGFVDSTTPSQSTQPPLRQGAIGASLLRAFKVILDYRHKDMTLLQNRRAFNDIDACQGVKAPFLPDSTGAAVSAVHTELGDLVALWDTGASVSIIRKAAAASRNAPLSNGQVTFQHLGIGSADFGPLAMTVADYAQFPGTDAILGYNFFEQHVVCIDYPNQQVLIQH
jgi:hypothetical protein